MTTWTSGYVADVGYTYGYYPELSPQRAKLAFIENGLAFPNVINACELGFGQGVSTNLHAAASNVNWWGTDFNPSQAAFAQELASAGKSGARLYDDSFEEFVNRTDLPDFDFIGLHGIWSWVSDENRSLIVNFIKRKLRVGGVLYVSYNTQPGWASFAPIRHLMVEHAQSMGTASQGTMKRIDGALEFAEKLFATDPHFAKANPSVIERLIELKKQDHNYLAHEYFNRDWHPMHFATMAKWLEPAKVQFACSANFLENFDAINFTPEQQIFLDQITDPIFRETCKDFMTNQQFRKDYWVKGAIQLSTQEQIDQLRQQRVILVRDRKTIELNVTGNLGKIPLLESVYTPILDELGDHNPQLISELEIKLSNKGINISSIKEAISILIGAGHLWNAQTESESLAALNKCEAINAHIIQKARGNNGVNYLASPAIASGINIGRFQQLFMLSQRNGKTTPQEWAEDAWRVLLSQGQRIRKEGKVIESEDENLAELKFQATSFAENQLPFLRHLGITI